MKIAEKFHDNHDGTFVVENIYDNQPYLDRLEKLRQMDTANKVVSDSYLVGEVPMHLLGQWLKESGVKWSDSDGVKTVLKRKLMDGEFSKLRVWNGTF